MKTISKTLLGLLVSLTFTLSITAQNTVPTVTSEAVYNNAKGEEVTLSADGMDAPLTAHFTATTANDEDYSVRFEWKIWNSSDASNILAHRFEQNMDYVFTESGTFLIQLYTTFVHGNDTISYPLEGDASTQMSVTIKNSKLEMPNAFSPNNDGLNDIYNAKSTYQSIVEFKATIFNRWGQKIYSWSNPDRSQDGWDGTWHGHKVKDGVYFVVVNAKGADGTEYKIRKDVNVLTGYDKQAKDGDSDSEE